MLDTQGRFGDARRRETAAAGPANDSGSSESWIVRLEDLRLPAINRRASQGRRLALARACGARPGLRVHDALAGWGTDGMVLAALGCIVHMSEHNATVHRILDERLRRSGVGTSITCALEDARDRWRTGAAFAVVYLDPMFGRHPKTALPGKHMQVLSELAGAVDEDEVGELIDQARSAASARIVVKRRAGATPYGRPDWRIRARSVRFDIYRPV